MNFRTLCTCTLLAASSVTTQALAEDFVGLTYDRNSRDIDATPIIGKCAVNVLALNDQRNNKDTIGTELRTITAGNPTQWMEDGLDSLSAYGFTVTRNATPVPGGVNLEFNLLRAYTWHLEMRIVGMAAADLYFVNADGTRTLHKVRGSGSKTNWAAAPSEYVTALNYAYNTMLHHMALLLAEKCKQSAAEPAVAQATAATP